MTNQTEQLERANLIRRLLARANTKWPEDMEIQREFVDKQLFEQAADLLAADKAGGEVDSTGFYWLCELMVQDSHHNPSLPMYVADKVRFTLTSDPYRAARFTDRELCHAVCVAAYGATGRFLEPVEHGFISHPLPQPSALPDDVVKDAERYRWLRQYGGRGVRTLIGDLEDAMLPAGDIFYSLDGAIDAAMLKEGK